MINELLSRPNIQEFLNKYPSNRWKELLTDLFEIGILNLRNSYHRDEFSICEFNSIIYNLEHPNGSFISNQNQYSYNNNNNQYTSNNQYKQSNFSYPKKSSNYNYQNSSNQKYLKENLSNYNSNYDYDRRMRRLIKLENRATTSKMDAFYSERNETPRKKTPKKKKRSHREIMDKIFLSQQKRQTDRYKIRDLKAYYMQNRQSELNQKRMEKMMEKQAEEDIKEEEREKKRQKEEEDYMEGYGEDHQEEDEIEEDEETDKYNDYNKGYEDEEEEEEEGEGEGEIEEGGEQEQVNDEGGEEEQVNDEGGEEEQVNDEGGEEEQIVEGEEEG